MKDQNNVSPYTIKNKKVCASGLRDSIIKPDNIIILVFGNSKKLY
jgi:hypothetical protein